MCENSHLLLGTTVVVVRLELHGSSSKLFVWDFSSRPLESSKIGEKHKDFCRTSIVARHMLLGSIDPISTKIKSWANRSIMWVPLSWEILWNKLGASFHSENPDLFLDFWSAVIFSLLGRYSAVRVITHWRRWSHIYFANWTNFKFWTPPIFNRDVKVW